MNVVAECAEVGAQERSYPLPRLVSVTWRRRERLQHAVGFLVAENATHMVMCDRFDGKHPDSRRIWTIDHADVVDCIGLAASPWSIETERWVELRGG